MLHNHVAELLARERQSDLRGEAFEQRRWRSEAVVEADPSLLQRLSRIFRGVPAPADGLEAARSSQAEPPAVSNQLNDCLAC